MMAIKAHLIKTNPATLAGFLLNYPHEKENCFAVQFGTGGFLCYV
jgi:hypothetical protein